MMYFLVLGLVALACCGGLVWGGWRLIRWGLAWLWPQRFGVAATRKQARKARAPGKKTAKSMRPGWLTQQLAPWRDVFPLGVLGLLLYGAARLAAHGIANAGQDAPAGFYRMVSALGWASLALLGLSMVGQWASWRRRRN